MPITSRLLTCGPPITAAQPPWPAPSAAGGRAATPPPAGNPEVRGRVVDSAGAPTPESGAAVLARRGSALVADALAVTVGPDGIICGAKHIVRGAANASVALEQVPSRGVLLGFQSAAGQAPRIGGGRAPEHRRPW